MSDLHANNKHILLEAEFKSVYIATFLASYMAGRYERDCMEGHIREAYMNQPVEDASFNANCAWESIQARL